MKTTITQANVLKLALLLLFYTASVQAQTTVPYERYLTTLELPNTTPVLKPRTSNTKVETELWYEVKLKRPIIVNTALDLIHDTAKVDTTNCLIQKIKRHYSKEGMLTFDERWLGKDYYKSAYQKIGNKLTVTNTSYHGDNSYSTKDVYYFNRKGKDSLRYHYENNVLEQTTFYTYNDSGQWIKARVTYSNVAIKVQSRNYYLHYNEKGHLDVVTEVPYYRDSTVDMAKSDSVLYEYGGKNVPFDYLPSKITIKYGRKRGYDYSQQKIFGHANRPRHTSFYFFDDGTIRGTPPRPLNEIYNSDLRRVDFSTKTSTDYNYAAGKDLHTENVTLNYETDTKISSKSITYIFTEKWK